jgi:hypothetical protein
MQAKIDKVARECVAVRLRLLNRVITNIYDDALRPLELKVSQMNILVAAAEIGTARPSEVCERGWLEVVPGEDGRGQPFRLTAQGRKLLKKALPAWNAAQQQVLSVFGDQFVEQLSQAVKRVRKKATAN